MSPDDDPLAPCTDITEVREVAAQLRREQRFLNVLLDNLEDGIVACDADGRMTIFNPAARRLHGLAPESDPIGRVPARHGLAHLDGTPLDQHENPLLRALAGERLRDVEIMLERRDGERRIVSVNGQRLVDETGTPLGAVVALHDVTDQRRNEERLAALAHHDPLTGLANRVLLGQRLQAALDALARKDGADPVPGVEPDPVPRAGPRVGAHRGSTALRGDDSGSRAGLAVLLADLDDFKHVNDTYGHDVGDAVLVAMARRLAAVVRPSDTVARLGGDEFVVLCPACSGEEELTRICARVTATLEAPYAVGGRSLPVTASVGGVYVDSGEVDSGEVDPSSLLSRADDAMYTVKGYRHRRRGGRTGGAAQGGAAQGGAARG
ncbi:MAG: diguanylate cyclase [Actinomycetota bacterium]|nr:diguanylate cyclase [Actinomycetota bacterium]